jgi:hypothetical protein
MGGPTGLDYNILYRDLDRLGESPRFLRRLNTLRGWSHEEDEQVLA